MSTHVNTNTGSSRELARLPDECPNCHKSISPLVLLGHKNELELEVFCFCPDRNCGKSFIAYYAWSNSPSYLSFLNKTSFGTLVKKSFNDVIKKVSAQFEIIYNQALQQNNKV